MIQFDDSSMIGRQRPSNEDAPCWPASGSKIMVALSGGVDSAVTTLRLLNWGFEVEGVTMTLFPGSNAYQEALKTADFLGIKLHHLDLSAEFEKEVVQYFCRTYDAGQTPNPCVVCNPKIKFGLLLDFALRHGALKLATGHYVRCGFDSHLQQYILRKARDPQKDQSYFLYALNQAMLAKSMFPLGSTTKDEVRREAAKAGIPQAAKKDSQEVCFIQDNDYQGFLRSHGCAQGFLPGDFVDRSGKVLGRHKGIACYTIGQRKGLGISSEKPVFVLKIDPPLNQVLLGEPGDLFSDTLFANKNNFISGKFPEKAMPVLARIRSGNLAAPAMLYPVSEDKIKLVFEQAQRAMTPGQSVVYYQEDQMLGGGIIMP